MLIIYYNFYDIFNHLHYHHHKCCCKEKVKLQERESETAVHHTRLMRSLMWNVTDPFGSGILGSARAYMAKRGIGRISSNTWNCELHRDDTFKTQTGWWVCSSLLKLKAREAKNSLGVNVNHQDVIFTVFSMFLRLHFEFEKRSCYSNCYEQITKF